MKRALQTLTYWYANDNILQATVTDSAGTPINNATVTANILKGEDALAPSPITLAYVASSAGIYRGVIPDTLDEAAVRDRLTAEIEIDAGADLKAHFWTPIIVRERRR